ncbi:hypothetical protein G7Z98_09225 [Pseudomonas stutzeri]|nr:hypothetical protein [Stutzerimonas stutzeri]
MPDRELLEMAANAAGVPNHELYDTIGDNGGVEKHGWNPLTDDGDALRLAAALGMRIEFDKRRVVYKTRPDAIIYLKFGIKWQGKDGFRAAITRAAAEIGKNR